MKEYAYLGNNIGAIRMGDSTYVVDTGDGGIINLIMHDKVYEPDLWWALPKLVKKGTLFIDVGANVGFHSVRIAKQIKRHGGGKVISFECNPRIFPLLQKNLALNGVRDVAVTRMQALYDSEGKLLFSADNNAHRVGAIVIEKAKNFGEEVIEVDAVTIDSVVSEYEYKDVLIKIDVEGREPFVVDGAKDILSQKGVNVDIVFEYMRAVIESTGVDVEAFIEQMLSYGYGFFNVDVRDRCFVGIESDFLLDKVNHMNVIASKRNLAEEKFD